MTRPSRHRIRAPWRPSSTGQAAAAWLLLQEKGDLSETDQRRFAEWLAEDDSHAQAYEDAVWALNITSNYAGEPELLEMRRAALMARGSRRRAWSLAGGAAAAAAGVAAILLWPAQHSPTNPAANVPTIASRTAGPDAKDYRTAIGERSAITLPDGSVATLDTDSRLRVVYSAAERAVHLVEGQALFEVAHGQRLPFRVYARGQRITAVGTVFNVRLEGDQVRIAMVQGTVKVRSGPARAGAVNEPLKEVMLTAGEATVAGPAAALVIKPVEIRDVAAWRGGQLVFNDVPLSEAVAEVNRYTMRPIALADGAIGRYRVSGVFKANDPGQFAQAMADVLPVRVTDAGNGGWTLRASAQ